MFTCRPALGNLKYCMMAPATVKSSHPSVEFEIIISMFTCRPALGNLKYDGPCHCQIVPPYCRI